MKVQIGDRARVWEGTWQDRIVILLAPMGWDDDDSVEGEAWQVTDRDGDEKIIYERYLEKQQ